MFLSARSGSADRTRTYYCHHQSECMCMITFGSVRGGGATEPSQKFTTMIFRPFWVTFIFEHRSVTPLQMVKFSNFSEMA